MSVRKGNLMNEDLNTMLIQWIRETVQANQQWSAAAVRFLNTLGNAIKEDTEYMRQSISRIEEMISRLETGRLENRSLSENMLVSEKAEKTVTTQGRYPASFYFRHKFPQDAMTPGYYLLITEEGNQLRYQLFDQQWKPVHSGFLPDQTLDSIQAAILISEMEGITDYSRYEMLYESAVEHIDEVVKDEVSEADTVEIVQKNRTEEKVREAVEDMGGAEHEKARGR